MSSANQDRSFDYSKIPEGYYQDVAEKGTPIRRAWHLQKFGRVLECLPKTPGQSILDIGCFAGTFLSLLPEETFRSQLGVDILESQVAFANRRFGTPFRSFRYIRHIADLAQIDQTFDCVTLIEVIEHLEEPTICELFRHVSAKLKKGGRLVLTTPNYASCWPVLEIIVNRLSDVSYEEQHITKFNFFTCIRRLKRVYRDLPQEFDLLLRTTSHFAAPFLAAFSFEASMKLSKVFPHMLWKNPFGNLILLQFRKK
ncbi:MAG: class I SAM-dependent methyltransferase [Thermoguttaceae bacterium]